MTDHLGDDTEFTELVDADVPRVDLVGRAANGSPGFLLMKQDAQGLMDPAFVRDLIGKTDAAAVPDAGASGQQVTVSGSPAAIAKLIHEAALAKTLGTSSEIPDNRAADGSLKEVSKMADEAAPTTSPDPVAKTVIAEPRESEDDPDLGVILAEPEDGLPSGSSAVDPGSAAWEAIDAATARKWTSILARAKHALEVMAEREDVEAATADPDDACNAMDLQDAACAVNYAISVVAPFAVSEQSEADIKEMAAVGKALTGFDPEPLDTIEALAQVTKAGRVLSTANEQAIRGAVESLSKVLASLPAPDSQDSGRSVAKTQETNMPHPEPESARTTGTAAGAAPTTGTPALHCGTSTAAEQAQLGTLAKGGLVDIVGKSATEAVVKADGEGKPPAVAVYDAKGKLVGIVDPTDITPISGADAGDDDQSPDPADTDATAEADTDLAPAPPGEVGTPADATGQTAPDAPADDDLTKQTDPTDHNNDTTSDALLKSSIAEAVKSGLADYSATQEQTIAKQAQALTQMADVVETLKGRIQTLEEQPAVPKVFTNGAVPPRDQMRGQDRGAPPIDVAKARELKKGLYGAADATEQNRIATDMQQAAITALQEIHQRA